jgi:hypothetical protein
MRFRAEDLRPHGWRPPQTLQIPDWCGCSTEYLRVPTSDGWWQMVAIWDPARRSTHSGGTGRRSRADGAMAIQWRPGSLRLVTPTVEGTQTVYESDVTAVPSPRLACPPARLTGTRSTPDSIGCRTGSGYVWRVAGLRASIELSVKGDEQGRVKWPMAMIW